MEVFYRVYEKWEDVYDEVHAEVWLPIKKTLKNKIND